MWGLGRQRVRTRKKTNSPAAPVHVFTWPTGKKNQVNEEETHTLPFINEATWFIQPHIAGYCRNEAVLLGNKNVSPTKTGSKSWRNEKRVGKTCVVLGWSLFKGRCSTCTNKNTCCHMRVLRKKLSGLTCFSYTKLGRNSSLQISKHHHFKFQVPKMESFLYLIRFIRLFWGWGNSLHKPDIWSNYSDVTQPHPKRWRL